MFSMKNALLHFQQAINLMLGNLVDVYALVYLDDTLIYSTMAEDQTKPVRAIFGRLSKSQFHLNCKKCTLFLLEVEFFGYMASKHRVLILSGKVLAI